MNSAPHTSQYKFDKSLEFSNMPETQLWVSKGRKVGGETLEKKTRAESRSCPLA